MIMSWASGICQVLCKLSPLAWICYIFHRQESWVSERLNKLSEYKSRLIWALRLGSLLPYHNPDMWHAKLLQSCLILWDPMDYRPPGFFIHAILHVRILECVAMPSSRGSSWPRDQAQVSCISSITGRFFTSEPRGTFHCHVELSTWGGSTWYTVCRSSRYSQRKSRDLENIQKLGEKWETCF